MQNFTIFDMVIIGITLVLGLKGLFRGLIKEVFGIIGIIGAIFVASRVSSDVGNLIAPFLAIENETTVNLIGFIVALISFWVIVYVLGTILSKMFSASGLGLFDRIFGFVFGAAKVFLIFSVITYALYQINSFKKAIDEKTKESVVMPFLIDVGSHIIKLDTSVITNKIDETVGTVVGSDKKEPKNTENKTENKLDEVKEKIENSVSETVNEIKDSVKENIVDEVKEKIEDIKEETTN